MRTTLPKRTRQDAFTQRRDWIGVGVAGERHHRPALPTRLRVVRRVVAPYPILKNTGVPNILESFHAVAGESKGSGRDLDAWSTTYCWTGEKYSPTRMDSSNGSKAASKQRAGPITSTL